MYYIIANWKMKMSSQEMLLWFDDWYEYKKDFSKTPIEAIVAPAHMHIPLISSLIKDNLKVGAQDVSKYHKGAHTGENGAYQIKEFCNYAIIGHSERNESIEEVVEKRDRCLENELTPIICFVNVDDIEKLYKSGVILAWEDPDNISKEGQYREKDPGEILKGVQDIRQHIPQEAILLYGGSVNRQNIKDLVNIEQLNGVLIGNASLDPKHFLDIIHSFQFKPVKK